MNYLDFSQEPDFSHLKEDIEWQREILFFWEEWNNENDYIIVNTSGSTGNPRPIKLLKKAVQASAKMTCEFFNLSKSQSALLCLPVRYIAGKMMLIRAQYAQLKLYYEEPKMNISIPKTIDFCAMTPSQCQSSFDQITFINTLLLGGEKVKKNLSDRLKALNINVYESYGMTETISHIALKNLKESSSKFKPLNGVRVSVNEERNIEIYAPHLSEEVLTTTDIGCVHKDGSFQIEGRSDNIINSAGVKISPEVLENKMENELGVKGMFYGEADQNLGERLILIIEGEKSVNIADFQRIGFKKHEIPKEIHQVKKLAKTENGKIDRKESIKKLKK